MFAFPVASLTEEKTNFISSTDGAFISQVAFSLSYLQALFPDRSDTSGYVAVSMDRDGSNKDKIFNEGRLTQQPVWSPERMNFRKYAIALI
jgi:hypothetical protein